MAIAQTVEIRIFVLLPLQNSYFVRKLNGRVFCFNLLGNVGNL